MHETVSAIVVTYNRKELLIKCLESLMSQSRPLDKIIVIDNASTDGTADFLQRNGFLDSGLISYCPLPVNIGGAGGFNEGICRGMSGDSDWFWLMDDDAVVEPDALESLFANECLSMTGVGVCRVVNPDYSDQQRVINGVRLKDKMFSGKVHGERLGNIVFSYPLLGILVNRKKIEKHGNIRKDFFIQADDLEWTLRLGSDSGIVYEKNAVLVHHDSVSYVERNILGKKLRHLESSSLWKDYYGFRNLIVVRSLQNKPYLFFATKNLIKTLLIRVFFDDFILASKIYILAYLHGVLKMTGKRLTPGWKG